MPFIAKLEVDLTIITLSEFSYLLVNRNLSWLKKLYDCSYVVGYISTRLPKSPRGILLDVRIPQKKDTIQIISKRDRSSLGYDSPNNTHNNHHPKKAIKNE